MNFYPLTFEPIYKKKIWGGRKLAEVFKRELPGNKIGESWELAAHPNGTSIVNNGPLKGTSLRDLVQKFPLQVIGNEHQEVSKKGFPLLIKFLDASDRLSVQVHPDDHYSGLVEGEQGKTEMWYIINAEPGARLVYGVKPGISKERFADALQKGQLESCLNEIEVKKGEVYFIPAGTVHAIMEGILIAEIQQNSDTTYRVYDWNRPGKDGNPRPLHIKQALEVINFSQENGNNLPLVVNNKDYLKEYLTICPYFAVELFKLSGEIPLYPDGERFYILISLAGQGEIICNDINLEIKPGMTILLPAVLEEVIIRGKLQFINTYIPPSREELRANLRREGFSEEEIEGFLEI
jgi:mannose-6-phosphate isomerase